MTDLVLVKSDVKKVPIKIGRNKSAKRDAENFRTAKAVFGLNGLRLDTMEQVADLTLYVISQTLQTLQPASDIENAPFLLSQSACERLRFAVEHLSGQIGDTVLRYRKDQEYLDRLDARSSI